MNVGGTVWPKSASGFFIRFVQSLTVLMERINSLLEKIRELNRIPQPTVIEIDLMMDYTRVMYADLLEWRQKVGFNEAITMQPPVVSKSEPRPAPMTAIMEPATEEPSKVSDTKNSNALPVEDVLLPPPVMPVFQPARRYAGTDIRQLVGINDKYQYISELFANNVEAYEAVMQELNTFDAEEEAIIWINNSVSTQFGWQDDTESVQAFFRLLAEYFSVS